MQQRQPHPLSMSKQNVCTLSSASVECHVNHQVQKHQHKNKNVRKLLLITLHWPYQN